MIAAEPPWASASSLRARRGARAALGAACLLLAACRGEHGTGPVPAMPVAVAISLPATVFRVGDTLRANVAAFDSAGHPLRGRSTRWESSNIGVASVSTSGDVVGVS